MAMNWKQIETSREARLWLGQIIVPLATVVIMASPETRKKVFDGVSNGAAKVKNTVVDGYNKVKRKFSKKEEEEDPCMTCSSYKNCYGDSFVGEHYCRYYKG